MSKMKTVAAIAVAVSATLLTAQFTMAQGCTSCSGGGYADGGNYGGGYVDGGGCGGGGCGSAVGTSYFGQSAGGGFGYPGGAKAGCGNCSGCRSGRQCQWRDQMKKNFDHASEVNARVMARNQAWPMPFACADRQLYFRMWEPMIDSGMMAQCTLSASHFDQETQELNSYGESAVSSIMQNMPASRRNIYIQNSGDQLASDSRMGSVRNTVQKWYGHVPAPSLAFTNTYPYESDAAHIEIINTASSASNPAPVISVGDSSGSTSDSGQ